MRYVVVWESMSEEEKAEFIRSQEAEHGEEINFLFVTTGVPRDESNADREKGLVSTSHDP
ncbi:hypothetical protein [Silicimonas sp. MF1-12-2]|uniref:hypothetical protein n=1 Tax=Silicimonas sp. MF1-12-2 TaxID=3384793 RepID=UPI0039B49D83